MMSQNRQSEKDRLMAESDYHSNIKGEEEIRNIMEHLDHQDMVIVPDSSSAWRPSTRRFIYHLSPA